LKRAIAERATGIMDLEDYESLLEEYLSIAKSLAVSCYFPSAENARNRSKRRYERPFQRRLYLVCFVIGQQISSRKQRNRIRKRINWKATSEAWNEAHPNDPVTPKVLKSTFYRAIQEDALQREFQRKTGVFTSEALWLAKLSQVLDDPTATENWAKVFFLREIFRLVFGREIDDQEKQLELEAVRNPNGGQERLDELLRRYVAFRTNIELDEANKMSKQELIEAIEQLKKGVDHERKHKAKKQK